MSRPSDSDINNIGWLDIGLAVAAVVVTLFSKEVILEAAAIGLVELIAAGVLILAIALGRRVLAPCLAPWRARRRARRREAYLEGLRDAVCARGNTHLSPMILPWISSDRGSDPPRPFDPQAAARFWEVLDFGEPSTALRAAGLRECDVHAWLDAGLSWAPEGDPRRDFAMQVLDFMRRRQSRRGLMMAGEPHAPMLGGAAHPERRRDEIDVSPLPGIESPGSSCRVTGGRAISRCGPAGRYSGMSDPLLRERGVHGLPDD